MQLNEETLRSFGLGRVFKDATVNSRINSLDVHRVEDLLVTASDDDVIRVYNTQSGTQLREVQSRRHGACHVTFAHAPQTILHASNKGDHTLRYLNLHSNSYLHYYKGHVQDVTSISMSPKTDLFLSSARDSQVRLWDLRTNVPQGLLQCPGPSCASFDEQGLIFGVGSIKGIIKLFDSRKYSAGPFDAFAVTPEANSRAPIGFLKFSPDGKQLVAVVEGRVYLLNAFTGARLHTFSSKVDIGGSPLEPSFSPDGQFLGSGQADRSIKFWDCQSGRQVATMNGHAGVPACLKWHPRRMLFASACNALGLWTLDTSKLMP